MKNEDNLSAGEYWLLFLAGWPMLTAIFGTSSKDIFYQKMATISIILWALAMLATIIIGMIKLRK
jgi:hypothetical protein